MNLTWLRAVRDAPQEGPHLPGIVQGSCMAPVSPNVATTASVRFPSIPTNYERVRAWPPVHAQDTLLQAPLGLAMQRGGERCSLWSHKVLIVQVSAKWDLFFPWVKSCYVSEGVRCARCGEHTTAWGRCGLWLSSSWGPTAGWEAGQGSSTSLKCFHAP